MPVTSQCAVPDVETTLPILDAMETVHEIGLTGPPTIVAIQEIINVCQKEHPDITPWLIRAFGMPG